VVFECCVFGARRNARTLFFLLGGEGQDEGEPKTPVLFSIVIFTLGIMADRPRARVLRKKETWAEKLMWSWLRDRRFSGYKFRRQHSVGIYRLWFRAASKCCVFGTRVCSVTFRTFAKSFSERCSNARLILYLITRMRATKLLTRGAEESMSAPWHTRAESV